MTSPISTRDLSADHLASIDWSPPHQHRYLHTETCHNVFTRTLHIHEGHLSAAISDAGYLETPLSLPVSGWQRGTQRAPGPHLSGCGDGRRQPHHPGPVQNRRRPQRHQDRVPGGRMNCTGTGMEEGFDKWSRQGKGKEECKKKKWEMRGGLKKKNKRERPTKCYLVNLLKSVPQSGRCQPLLLSVPPSSPLFPDSPCKQ